ncbi:MAG: Serine/threonine kinase [Myxococcales bacterium]|nr:Serine/threonine kinase [Myxococcales bacterium]
MPCLDDNEVADFVEGRLSRARLATVKDHLDICAACRELVVAAATDVAPATGAQPTGAQPTALPLSQTLPTIADAIPHLRGEVIDRYVVIGRIGAGAMGAVYAAYDPELDRKVAVKLLRTDLAPGSGARSDLRARLLREGKSMARLSHPCVVPIFDVGAYHDQVFIAMEFVDGVTLREWMKPRRPWGDVLLLLQRAGEGLRAAHEASIVHRDFKPDNVLVHGPIDGPPARERRVRVTDFGLATAAQSASGAAATTLPLAAVAAQQSLTMTGSLIGTPAYMAPEQMEGHPGPRADQFSFCVTLYEALYGVRPFVSGALSELAAEIRANRVGAPPPGAQVPAWLRRIVVRGLRANPGERWPSMNALLTALEARPFRSLRRAAIPALMVVAVAGVGFAWHSVREARALECHGAEAKLAGVWDEPTRARVERAFSATGVPYATASFAATRRLLDDYASGWARMHGDACTATRVRREQSEELLDLRMLCLDDHEKELGALAQLFTTADAETVEKAPAAAAALTPLAECADTRGLTARERPPRDPALAAKVRELSARSAEVRALDNTGKYDRALAAGQAALATARTVGHAASHADLAHVTGVLLLREGKLDEGIAVIHEAAQAAARAHDDAAVADAWAVLVYAHGTMQAHTDEALRWAAYARAELARSGNADSDLMTLLENEGQVLAQAGRTEEGLADLRQAVALAQKVSGKDSIAALRTASNMGNVLASQGRYEEARDLFRHAMEVQEKQLGASHPDTIVAIENYGAMMVSLERGSEAKALLERGLATRRQILGPKHPYTATAALNLAEAYADEHRYADALALNREALATLEATVGTQHPYIAEALTNVGIDLMGLGKAAQALAPLERAVQLHVALKSSGVDAALTRFALARALLATGGDRSRARQLAGAARQAYADSAKQFGGYAATRRDQVATWITTSKL